MNDESKSRGISIGGGILIFVTVLIYAIGCRNIIKVPTRVLLSFFFVIIAEVATFYVTLKTKMEVLRSGVITTTVLYLFSTIILALLFVNLVMNSATLYAIINLVLMGIAAIAIFALNSFADHVNKSNNKILAAEAIMIKCQDKIQSYLNDDSYSEYKEELNRIYEDIKYSDISSECGMEGALLQKIEEISENKEGVLTYLKEISFLIKERNIKMKSMKRGSI